MNSLFADTSFYIALVNPCDAYHGAADRQTRECRAGVVTTEYVLVEVGNCLSRSGDRRTFVELIDAVWRDPLTRVVPAGAGLFEAGIALYRDRLDKDWSLTDCLSFVVMEQEGLTDALTADRHFEQAGFRALMRGEPRG